MENQDLIIKKYGYIVAFLVALCILLGSYLNTYAATNTYTFTIVCNNASFVDFRGNVYKIEPITFTVKIPTSDGTFPCLQKSSAYWCASGWNGNGNSFYSTKQANAYGYDYSSSLGTEYLSVTNLDIDISSTTIPLWDYTANKGYWNGNTFNSITAMQDAYLSEIKQQQSEIIARQYPAPEFVKVTTDINMRGEVIKYKFHYKAYENDNVSSLLGGCVVKGIDLNGDTRSFEFGMTDYQLTESNVNYWDLDTIHDEYIAYFDVEAFKKTLKSANISNFQITSIKMETKYEFEDGNTSKYAKHTYDVNNQAVTGTTYNPDKGEYEQNVSVDVTDWGTNHNQVSINETMSLQGIVDWFVNALNSVVSSINRVFAMVTSLISSAMGFINYLGTIFQTLFGSTLGTIMTLGLLSAIILRLFAR